MINSYITKSHGTTEKDKGIAPLFIKWSKNYNDQIKELVSSRQLKIL